MIDPTTNPDLEHWMMAGWPTDLPTPSSWERVANCPRSEAMPHLLQQDSVASLMGTVAHAYLADCLTMGREAALAKTPLEHRDWLEALDVDKLPLTQGEFWPEVAVAYDLQTGKARVLGHNLTRAQARAMKSPTEVVGLMDVAAGDAGPDTVFVGDFKTGWGHVTAAQDNLQLKGYALMLARALGRSQAVVSIIRVRTDGSTPWYDTARLTAADLDAFEYDVVMPMFAERDRVRAHTRVKNWGALPPHKEGSWCKYCPAQTACAPRIGAMMLAAGDTGAPLNLTPERAGKYWHLLDVVENTASRWKGLLEDLARVSPFPLGNGFWVGTKGGKKPSETILPDRARDVLVKLFGELGSAAYSDAVEISDSLTKAKLKSAVRKLILPTRPSTTKITHLFEGEVLPALRAGGATTTGQQKKIPVGEYRPKDEGETDAAPEAEDAAA